MYHNFDTTPEAVPNLLDYTMGCTTPVLYCTVQNHSPPSSSENYIFSLPHDSLFASSYVHFAFLSLFLYKFYLSLSSIFLFLWHFPTFSFPFSALGMQKLLYYITVWCMILLTLQFRDTTRWTIFAIMKNRVFYITPQGKHILCFLYITLKGVHIPCFLYYTAGW